MRSVLVKYCSQDLRKTYLRGIKGDSNEGGEIRAYN